MNRHPASTPSCAATSSAPSSAPSPMKAAQCSSRRICWDEVEEVADHVTMIDHGRIVLSARWMPSRIASLPH